MKIVYAAGQQSSSYQQLLNYLPLFKQSTHQFVCAGYKHYLNNIKAQYCLDALLNFTSPNNKRIFFNSNYSYYCKELDRFNPDLIISDIEPYTSLYAIDKNIPLWQVSFGLLYYALPLNLKKKLSIHKRHANLINGNRRENQFINYILRNSTRRLVLSHLGDFVEQPELDSTYQWLRPEFKLVNSDLPAKINSTGFNLANYFYNQQSPEVHFNYNELESITSAYLNSYYQLSSLPSQKPAIFSPSLIKIDETINFLMDLL